MVRNLKFIFLLFVFLTNFSLWSQTQWPATNFDANETVTLSPAPTPIRIDFPLNDHSGNPIVTYDIKTYPNKGSLSAITFDGATSGYYVSYTPNLYENGMDTFEWNATIVGTTTYRINIDVAQINNEPVIQGLSSSSLYATFAENQNAVGTVTVFDPDNAPSSATNFTRTPLGVLNLNISGTNAAYFSSSFSSSKSTVPDYYVWDITFNSGSLNYESWFNWKTNNNAGNWFKVDFNASDVDGSSNPLSDHTLTNLEIAMSNVNEPPEIQEGAGPAVPITIDEDNAPTSWPTGGVTLTAVDVDSSGSLKWKFVSSASSPLGDITISRTSGGSETLSPNTWSTLSFNSSTTIKIDYSAKADLFGSETLTFTVSDRDPSNPLEDFYTVNVSINQNPNDDPPSLNQANPITIPVFENVTGAIFDFNSTDTDLPGTTDHASLSYYVTGTDAGFFNISSSGELSFIVPPDFEVPQDDNLDNTYLLTVGVNDNDVNTINDQQTLSVVVSNTDEAPRLTTLLVAPYAFSLNEDSNWTWTDDFILNRDLNATDDDTGQTISWGLETPAGKGVVDISGSGSQPNIFTYTADDNETGADTFTIKVFDTTAPTPLTYTHVFNVTINNLPDDPIITRVRNVTNDITVTTEANATITVDEISPGIIYFTSSDADVADTLTYLIEGPDSNLFNINSATGELTFKVGAEPDFESASDANSNGLYELTVKVEDNATPKGFDALTLFIAVQNQNEAPSGITPTSVTIPENTSFVVDLNASDIDYDDNNSNLSWSLDSANGLDTDKFTITSDGNLSFIIPPNYEVPNDADTNNTYEVGVKVTDSGNSFTSATLSVFVENANDAPVISLLNPEIPVAEGVQSITTFVGTDEDDPSANLIWSITDGNTSIFNINSTTGVLRFVSTLVMPDLDFNATGQGEAALDSKIFDLNITARDANNTEDTRAITVKVEQANDSPIVDLTYLTNGVIEQSMNEDSILTLPLSLIISDPEGQTMNYLITSQASNYIQSEVSPNSGTLIYRPTANWSGFDDLNVTVTDSAGNQQILQVAILVNPINDPPSFTNYISSFTVDEGTTSEIHNFDATDIDSNVSNLSFGLTGVDASRFSINITTGSLTFASVPDFENPGDTNGDNYYDFNVTVTDSENDRVNLPVSVNVRDVKEPPTLTGSTLAIDVDEQEVSTVDLNTYFGTQGGSLTFAKIITEQNGTATLHPSTGVLTYTSNQDFSGSDYLEINATDSGVSTTLMVAYTIFNVNDPPVIPSKSSLASSTLQVLENNSSVIDLNVSDPNDSPPHQSTTFTWSLGPKDSNSSHLDWNYFSINPSTGVLNFKDAPDFESDPSILATNIYELVAHVSDNKGGAETDSVPLRIQVINVDESPSFSKSIEVLSTIEDTSVDGNLSSYFSDPESIAPVFVFGTPNNGILLNTNPAGGTFTYHPNSDFNGTDQFEVNATDGFNTPISMTVTVNVTPVNDPPVITQNYSTPILVEENLQYVFDLNVSQTDNDETVGSYLWSISPLNGDANQTDYVYFNINDETGQIIFISSPDFDTDLSVAQTNIYEFAVSVSDLGGVQNGGTQTDSINLKVKVTDGDEDPILYIDKNRSSQTSSLIVEYQINEDQILNDNNFSSYAVDPEGLSLNWRVIESNETNGTATIGLVNGNLEYIPYPHFNGNDNFDINVTDPSGRYATITVSVVVSPVDDTPFFTWPTGKTGEDFKTLLVSEGETLVLDFNASDSYDFKGDYNHLSAVYFWSLNNKDNNSSHTDVDYFKINPTSGAVSFKIPADTEDNGSVNSSELQLDPDFYEFDVVVKDQAGLSATHPVKILIVPVNEAPILSQSGTVLPPSQIITAQIAEDEVYTLNLSATDPEGDSISWIISSPGNGVASYLTPTLTYTPNANYSGSDTFDVNATDGEFNSTVTIELTITPVNDPPEITSKSVLSFQIHQFNENSQSEVIDLNVTDSNDLPASTNFLWSLGPKNADLNHTDYTFFEIDPTDGKLFFKTPPNFEGDNSNSQTNLYELVVFVSDNQGVNHSDSIPLRIKVNDINESPNSAKQSIQYTIVEDANVVDDQNISLNFTDQDAGANLTYSYSNPSDGNITLFSTTTGSFTYSPDQHFNGIDSFEINATDGDFNSSLLIEIIVTPVSDPPVIENKSALSSQFITYEENRTDLVIDLNVSDPYDDPSSSNFTWTIGPKDGDANHLDHTLFNINVDGELSFKNQPNYEDASSPANNIYELVVEVNDHQSGNNTDTVSLRIRVIDINEAPLSAKEKFEYTINEDSFILDDANISANFSDPDSDSLIYTNSQPSNGTVILSSSSGEFRYTPDLNYFGSDSFEINATDGGFTSSITIDVVIKVVNDAPVITNYSGSPIPIKENLTSAIKSFNVTDVESSAINLSVSLQGVDANLFYADKNVSSDGNCSISLHFRDPPDYETPLDDGANGYYDVTLLIKDEGGPLYESVGEFPVLIYVEDVLEDPIFNFSQYPLSSPYEFSEDNTSEFTLQVLDPDLKSGLTWNIPSQTDQNASLTSTTKDLQVGTSQAVILYTPTTNFVGDDNVTISVTDRDGQQVTQLFTFRVLPSNDQPEFSYYPSNGVILIFENNASVYDFDASDAYDGNSVTSGFDWQITGGADGTLFKINQEGELTFITAPNFEIPTDVNEDNQYELNIGVSDEVPDYRTQSLLIKVQPANDAPVFTSFDSNGSWQISIEENVNIADSFVVVATDVEGDAISFSLTSDTPNNDNSLFAIDPISGALSFVDSTYSNFEGNLSKNNYIIEVNSTDDGSPQMSSTQEFNLIITDADEAPSFNSGALSRPNEINENQNDVVWKPLVEHADQGQTLRFELLQTGDYSVFELNSTVDGSFRFISPPNFEVPLDSNGDNVYNLSLQVFDSNKSNAVPVQQTISITVKDLNEQPSFINPTPTFWINYAHMEGEEKVIVLEDYLNDVDGGNGLDDLIAHGQNGIIVENDLTSASVPSFSLQPFQSDGDVVQVRAADFDRDGIRDLLVMGKGSIYWYRGELNSVSGDYKVNYVRDSTIETGVSPLSIEIGDFDGNGHDDFVTSYADKIIKWYPFDKASNNFSSGHLVAGSEARASALQHLTIGDVNGDLQPDILGVIPESSRVIWYANKFLQDNENPVLRFNQNSSIISNDETVLKSPRKAMLADMDNDGSMDLIVSSFSNPKILLFKNDGSGNFSSPITIVENQGFAKGFTVGNFDGDAAGLKDVAYSLLTSTGNGQLRVSIQSSINEFNASSVISLDPTSIAADDIVAIAMDNDAHLDLIALYGNEGVIRLYQNGGGNGFSSVGDPIAGFNGSTYLQVADLDIKKDPINYTLLPSEGDGTNFEIFNQKTGDLRFKVSPDYESPTSNSNGNNYNVTIEVSDGTSTVRKEISINVTDKNEPPSFVSPVSETQIVAENTSLVLSDLEFTDSDDNPNYTFSLEGADKDLFELETIAPSKDRKYSLSFKSDVLPSYEDFGDSNKDGDYEVTVRVTDIGDLTATRDIRFSLSNQDDPPSFVNFPTSPVELSEDLSPDGWTAPSMTAVDLEDNVTVNPITWSISLAPVHGVASFADSNDPASLIYTPVSNYFGPDQMTIRIDDSNQSNAIVEKILHLQVLSVNDEPVQTLPTDEILVPENTQFVLNVPDYISDIDSNVTASLIVKKSSNDNDLFEIDRVTQVLRFKSPPNFEDPQDLSSGVLKDNIYLVELMLQDGITAVYPPQIRVRVTNQNDAPYFSNVENPITVYENESSTLIRTFQVEDGDIDANQTLTYSVSGGLDAGLFEFGNSGELHFKSVPDYENPQDLGGVNVYDNIYVFEITVTDSGQIPLSATQEITLIVLDSNDPPVFSTPKELKVNENETLITTIEAIDTDFGDTVSYSVANPSNDSLVFIDPDTGVLRLKKSYDYEQLGSLDYFLDDIEIIASDGNRSASKFFKINLQNINDNLPLLDLNLSGESHIHYEFSGPVLKVRGNDTDKLGPLSYHVLSGVDKEFFTINAEGELSFIEPYSYDLNNSENGDDIYEVGLKVFDGEKYSPVYMLEIDLRPIDKTPPEIVDDLGVRTPNNVTFLSNINENTTFVHKLEYIDPETPDLLFSVEGNDKELFNYDVNTSILSFINPVDSDNGRNSYIVDLVLSNLPNAGIISDGRHVSVATFYIIVQPIDEPPLLTSTQTTFYLPEDSFGFSIELNATDPENVSTPVSYQISSPNNGLLSGLGPQFYYTPNPNFNGVDEFVLTLEDSTQNSIEHNITLIVNSVNDQPIATPDNYTDISYTSGVPIVLPLLQNDSFAPDLNETLTISALGTLEIWNGQNWELASGTVSPSLAKTEVLFTPVSNGLGFYRFPYTMSDGSLSSTAQVHVLVQESSSLPGWNYLKNFGFYNTKPDQWVYHAELGWLYMSVPNGEKTFTWMWSETLGWIWTGDQHPTEQISFPYFYSEVLSAWCNILFHDNELPKTLSSGNWILYKYDNDTTATLTSYEFMQMLETLNAERNKALFQAELSSQTDLTSAIQIIRNSTLFTAEEKDGIEFQLYFNGQSSILSNAGITLIF